ncbi:DUF6612 family protein [Cohnella herbarum]|uniref:Outer membrane lipoprotein carrier protein LolA n=1 Tax=Cohnella herbarum TaxID=2728023 RepID=A0A7Z2ZQD1_9BACL|nr:DUF6612 family protein [Cohnella herbarum]QJD86902.1 hypothetical protein HH215_29505 [Cohnella herbarum]
MKNGIKRFAKLGMTLALSFGLLGTGAAFAAGAEKTIAVQKVSEGEKALGKTMAAFTKVKSFAYDATANITTNGEKIQSKSTGEHILLPKMAFKMTTTMTVAGQKTDTSIIQVDNKVYVKLPGSADWTASDLTGALSEDTQADLMFDKSMLNAFDKIGVKKVGNDQEITMTVNPKKYSELFESTTAVDVNIKKLNIKYTVDGKTWLPKKVTMSMEAGADGVTVKSDMAYTYKSFNQVKPIKAPTVAK